MRCIPLLAVAALGCDLFKPPPSAEDAGPREYRSPRLAAADLPFELADDLPLGNVPTALNFGSATEVGPQVGLSLFTSKAGGLSDLVPDSLLAVAALPDRVVTVFPSAPNGELMVAQGGLDRPWVAQPLDSAQPLLRPQVGALDAVVDADGSVLIAVRRRPFSLWLYRFRATGSIERESIPAQGPAADHWSTSRCPDVRLDATATGGVALAYLAGPRAGLLWRKPGRQDWTQHFTPPRGAPGEHLDVGCVNRVVLDDSGFPQLLSLVRTWDRAPGAPQPYDPLQPGTSDPSWRAPGQLPVGLTGRAPPVTAVAGFVMLADGVLSSRAELSRPEAFISVKHPWHPGFFAFDRHPGGVLISGPSVNWSGGGMADVQYRVHDPRFDSRAPWPTFAFSFTVNAVRVETPGGVTLEPDLRELEPRSAIDHLVLDPCGGVEAWGATRTRLDLARQYVKAPSAQWCLGAPVAPIAMPVTPIIDSTPAFAHGRRPYDVAICTGGSRLAVCLGGRPPLEVPPLPEDEEPRLVTVDPAAGEIPRGTSTARFTLSRPIASSEVVEAGFWDVTGVAGERVAPQVDGATVTVTFPRSLQPGAVYRVALQVLRTGERDRAWAYLDGKAPAATWWTAKSASAIDPRVTRLPFPCEGSRDDAGVCLLDERKRGLAGQSDDIGAQYDLEALPLGPPSVYDASGQRVSDAVAEVLSNGTSRFTWGRSLARDAVYEVRFPEGILTFVRTEWLPEDRVLRFRTTP